MIARYGLWFAAGFLPSLLHGWMIARSVHRYDPGLRGTARCVLLGAPRCAFWTSAGAMGLALVDGSGQGLPSPWAWCSDAGALRLRLHRASLGLWSGDQIGELGDGRGIPEVGSVPWYDGEGYGRVDLDNDAVDHRGEQAGAQAAPEALEMLYASARHCGRGDGYRRRGHLRAFPGDPGDLLVVANNISIVPVLQSATKDINTTVALALLVLVAVFVFGFVKKGISGYLRELATPMLILDVIGHISRTLSLSLRLFGNVMAGEIIVAVMYRLVQPIAPLPMIGLGLITGVLQAYVFLILAAGAIGASVQPKGT